MNRKLSKLASAVALALAFGAGSAQAAIVVDNWTLDLTGVDGLGPIVVNNIDQIVFTGVANARHVIDAGGGTPDAAIEVDDIGRARGLLGATTFLSDGGQILPGVSFLGVDYELTFTFDVLNLTTIVTGPDQNFTHLGAGHAAYGTTGSTGLLNLYIDAFANGGTVANQLTGAGYDDGELVATFRILPGAGGVFNAITFNGSDDAIFELVSAKDGVILDGPGGNDIAIDGELLAVTASQFDADKDNNGSLDVACPSTKGWGPATGATNFCAQEDGRASLQIPEPASVALIGLGLLGLGASRRQWKKR